MLPFTLKSKQFMSEVFPVFVGTFSDIMEETELNFSFAETEFWIVFSFLIIVYINIYNIFIAWALSGLFQLLVNIRTNVRI